MKEGVVFKKKPEKKELPAISREVYHPAEAMAQMAENATKKSESAHSNTYSADTHLRIAANAEKIEVSPERFYQLVRSLKG